ncbi:MAG: Slp family lipoprotein [Thiotrichaceae bacterium]|nr:Slp family lipoprotein [Thiotrichaceae bacterium]
MNYNRLICAFAGLLLIIILPGCSSKIPPEIRQKLVNSPSVTQAREQLESHLSNNVRWGGIIVSTENNEKSSRLAIVSLPLSSNGKPKSSDDSAGRFLAIVDEFLEPMVYSRDRQITVTGTIVGSEAQKVGDFLYEYPVVKVDHYYLWPLESDPVILEHPFYSRHDLWFYPNYFPGTYPYRLNNFYR